MKMIKYKQIIPVLLLLSFAVFFFFHCKRTLPPRDYPEIKETGILRVVMDYSPSGFFRTGDSIKGKQYRYIMALSEHLDIPVEIHLETTLQESLKGLNEGKYDLVARMIPVTSELRELVSFTENIMIDRQVLVQRKASDSTTILVRNLLELPGKKIYVPHGSPYIPRLKNLADEIGDTIQIEEMPDYESEHLIILVAKGDIDYAVCDYQTASKMVTAYPILDVTTDISFSQMHAWAVRKNSPQLLDSINGWIKEAKNVKKK